MQFGFKIRKTVLESYDAPVDCDKEVTIPEGIRVVGKEAFLYRRGMKKVIIPEGVEEIRESAFYMCTGLKEISLPVSLKKIGKDAFGCCEAIEKIYYAGSNTQWSETLHGCLPPATVFCRAFDLDGTSDPRDFKIEDGVLMKYKGSESVVYVPEGVHTIARWALGGAGTPSKITHVVLPEGVTTLGTSAFTCQSELRVLVLPKSLKAISWDVLASAGKKTKTVYYRGTLAEFEEVLPDLCIPFLTRVIATDGEKAICTGASGSVKE